MNDFAFTEQGFSDYLYWQMQDKKTLNVILQIKYGQNKQIICGLLSGLA